MNDRAAVQFLERSIHHLQDDFLPKIHRSVDLLDEEEIWYRPSSSCNSVGNLILHLCGNVRQWVISGVGGEPDSRERSSEFKERGPLSRGVLVGMLDRTVGEAVDVLRRTDPGTLLERRHIQVYDVSLLEAVLHVVEHFSYHTGQIVYIVKMLKDVDLKFYDL